MDHYVLWFKAKNESLRWKIIETKSDENCLTVSRLMAKTKYTFKVYCVFKDGEGKYGPENDVETKMSLAKTLVGCSTPHKMTSPSIYLLPIKEDMNARNVKYRTRHLVFGKFTITILMSLQNLKDLKFHNCK